MKGEDRIQDALSQVSEKKDSNQVLLIIDAISRFAHFLAGLFLFWLEDMFWSVGAKDSQLELHLDLREIYNALQTFRTIVILKILVLTTAIKMGLV